MQLFDRTLGQWLEHWAEETPDKEYIVYSDRNLRFTWSQLNRRVDDMAKGLIAIGVERGTHVGIWAANVPDWLTLLYACAKIGAVYVTSCFLLMKEKSLSWLWKVSWKSAMARTPICWKRVIAFIMIPLFLIMYMLMRDRLQKSWQ